MVQQLLLQVAQPLEQGVEVEVELTLVVVDVEVTMSLLVVMTTEDDVTTTGIDTTKNK